MNKNLSPLDLAIDLLPRSTCNVQVAAVIVDSCGRIVSWGWNHVGKGLGCHAEAHAISRANKDRLAGGVIVVVARRLRKGRPLKPVKAKPCEDCQKLISKHRMLYYYRGADGKWYVD